MGAGHAPAARTVAIASGASNPSTVAQAVVLDADALRPPERARRRVPAPRVARLPAALRRRRDLRRSAAGGGRARRADRATDRPRCRATATVSGARRWTTGARAGSRTPRSASKRTCTTRRLRRRAAARSSSSSSRACSPRRLTVGARCGSCGSSRGSRTARSRSSSRPTTRSSTDSPGVEVARAVLDGGEDAWRSRSPGRPPLPGGLLGRTLRDGVDGAKDAVSLGRAAGIAGAGTRQDARRRARGGSGRPRARARARRRGARHAPARERLRAGVRDASPASWRTSRARTRRSTTCCWRRSRARCGASCTPASCAPKGSSCARSCRLRCARREAPAASSATASRACRATLPVGIADPLGRLEAVRSAMTAAKASPQALGVRVATALGGLVPPPLIAALGRTQIAPRLFNLVVTNVPGPREELSLLGRPLRAHPSGPAAAARARALDRDALLRRPRRSRAARGPRGAARARRARRLDRGGDRRAARELDVAAARLARRTVRAPCAIVPAVSDLPRRTLGSTGLEVTTLGFGAMELRGPPSGPVLSDAQAGAAAGRRPRRGHQLHRHLDRLRAQRGADRQVHLAPPLGVRARLEVRLRSGRAAGRRARAHRRRTSARASSRACGCWRPTISTSSSSTAASPARSSTRRGR